MRASGQGVAQRATPSESLVGARAGRSRLRAAAGLGVAAVAAVSLAACGSSSSSSSASGASGATSSTAVATTSSSSSSSGGGSYTAATLRLADYLPITDTWSEWAQKLAKKVSADTGGKVSIKIFPNSELGTNTDSLTGASQGSVDMTLTAPQLEDTLAPGLGVQFLPGIFTTNAQAAKVIASPKVLALENEALKPHNLQTLSQCFAGNLVLVSKQALPNLASMKGVKFRVPDQPNADMITALGATPDVIPLAEAYTALQTGEVDGTPAAVSTALSQKYYSIAKYLDLTPLSPDFRDLVINTSSLSKLSAADQKVLLADSKSLQPACSTAFEQARSSQLAAWKKAGGTVVPADSNISEITDAFKPLLAKGQKTSALAGQLFAAMKAAAGKS